MRKLKHYKLASVLFRLRDPLRPKVVVREIDLSSRSSLIVVSKRVSHA